MDKCGVTNTIMGKIDREMNPENEKEGMFRLNILKLLRESPQGMTQRDIAQKLGETPYKTGIELAKLEGLLLITVDMIGNNKIVRVK